MSAPPLLFQWEHLSTLLAYDAETGVFTWRIRPNGRVPAGSRAGSLNSGGYSQIKIGRRLYGAHRLAWFYVHKQWPTAEIDHIDGNPSNNAIANLRLATRAQQMANIKRASTNTSGFKGVSFHKKSSRWRAYISISGRPKHLGYFDSPERANAAYVEAAKAIRGDFARAR